MRKITTSYYGLVEEAANNAIAIVHSIEEGWDSGEIGDKMTVIEPDTLYKMCQALLLLYSVAVEKQLINTPKKLSDSFH